MGMIADLNIKETFLPRVAKILIEDDLHFLPDYKTVETFAFQT
jgi:hypothetical protein